MSSAFVEFVTVAVNVEHSMDCSGSASKTRMKGLDDVASSVLEQCPSLTMKKSS